MILINGTAGAKLFVKIKEMIEYRECKIEDSMQTPLEKPFEKQELREQFWVDFNSKPFEFIAKKYGGYGIINDLRRIASKVKRKFLRV